MPLQPTERRALELRECRLLAEPRLMRSRLADVALNVCIGTNEGP